MMRKLGKKVHEMVESVEAYSNKATDCNAACNSMCPSDLFSINHNIWRGQYY